MRIDRAMLAGLDRLRIAAPIPSSSNRPGDRRSRVRGRGLDIADFRPYTPGDDLRLVDWNIFTRLDAVLVRLFHEDRDLSLLVMIDASASMAFGTPRKIDHAGELAACLALLALRARERVRVTVARSTPGAVSERSEEWPERGGRAERANGEAPVRARLPERPVSARVKGDHIGAMALILDVLDRVEPAGVADLGAALGAEAEGGRSDHAVLLSDLLVEPELRESTLRRLATCARRPILLHVLGDSELTPDLEEGVLVDSESGEEIPIRGGRSARDAYASELARWRSEIETRCSELGIVYAPAFTTVPVRALMTGEMRRRQVTQAARGGGR